MSKIRISTIYPVLLLFTFLILSNSLQAQTIPMCSAPQNLLIWPNMATNTIPVALSSGVLTNSPITYASTTIFYAGQKRDTAELIRIGNSVNIWSSKATSRGNNWSNWLRVNWGGITVNGPRRNYHSGGSITFLDDSTSTDKLFLNYFTIANHPSYMYWQTELGNQNVPIDEPLFRNPTSSEYGNLRFFYSEYNPTNESIRGRLGRDIPPGDYIYKDLMTLTWDGRLLIGTTTRIGSTGSNLGVKIEADDTSRFADHIEINADIPSNATNPWFGFSGSGLGHHRGGIAFKNTGGRNDPRGDVVIWARKGGNIILNPGNSIGSQLTTESNGNVGIGTDNPTEKLEVVGNIKASGFCLGNDCRTTWSGAGTSYWILSLSGINLYATPTNVRVGIGTTNPTERLHVIGNIKATGTISADTMLSSGGSLRVNYGANLAINGGNVGIGTTNPQAKLHVIGDIKSSATITAPVFCIGNSCRSSWPVGGGGSINGTANYIAKFANNSTVINSQIFDNGTNVGIGTTNPSAKLDVNGAIAVKNGIYFYYSGIKTINSGYENSNISIQVSSIEKINISRNYLDLKGETRIYSSDGSRLILGISEE